MLHVFKKIILKTDPSSRRIDGLEVIKKIRSWSSVPITVISSRSEDKDKIDALNARLMII